MKKFTLVTLLALFTLAAAEAQTKKYDIKSGIVTFKTTVKMARMEIKTKSIVYFDDYGLKECKETYDANGKVKEWFLSDGKDLYGVYFELKEAYKRGKAYSGTEMPFNWNGVSEKDKQSGKFKKAANVTVAGKNCESFVLSDENGKTTFAGWNHITLLTDLDQTARDMKSITKAVKIEENAKVPAEKFKIPAGFALK
jgi:hypothetical protein